MRLVFFGTPEFAVPSLRLLFDRGEDVAAVVCQPDRPAGRGQRLAAPPVKLLAQERGVPVLQPERLRSPEALAALRACAPELIIVAAYGKLLPADVLHLPPRGCINVHASLLPLYRGAAPIQWAILRGETVTGVTIMQMDAGMDTGAILLQRSTDIRAGETYGELQVRLAHLGAVALGDVLDALRRGEVEAMPQDDARATLAPKIEKEQGRIDWSRSAAEIERCVRAFNPWPSAWTTFRGEPLKVHRATVVGITPSGDQAGVGSCGSPSEHAAAPGCVLALEPELVVTCGSGCLRLDEVQPGGRQRMAGAAFARGARLAAGARLG